MLDTLALCTHCRPAMIDLGIGLQRAKRAKISSFMALQCMQRMHCVPMPTLGNFNDDIYVLNRQGIQFVKSMGLQRK